MHIHRGPDHHYSKYYTLDLNHSCLSPRSEAAGADGSPAIGPRFGLCSRRFLTSGYCFVGSHSEGISHHKLIFQKLSKFWLFRLNTVKILVVKVKISSTYD